MREISRITDISSHFLSRKVLYQKVNQDKTLFGLSKSSKNTPHPRVKHSLMTHHWLTRSTSWTNLDSGPRNLVKNGRRWTGFLSGPSTPWTDSDGGPRFFIVSGRRWTGFLSGPSTSWTDLDAGPGLSFLRWTSGRMDGPSHGWIRTADHHYHILSGRPDGWTVRSYSVDDIIYD